MSDSYAMREDRVGVFQMAVLILTVLNLSTLVADTVLVLPKEVSKLIEIADTAVCVVFFADFVIRFRRAESKRAFIKWGWIDLVASIPNLDVLRWGRLVRVLRVIRLLRGIRSAHRILTMVLQNKAESGVVSVGLSAFLLVAFSSASILICERDPNANIRTAEDAVWWSVTTMTTVGYGDKYPVTTEGRVMGMLLMIGGIGLFGALSGLAASFFLGGQAKQDADARAVLDQLDQIQAKLNELAKLNKKGE